MRWFAVVVVAFACKSDDMPAKPSPPPPPALGLFTDAETAALEADLTAHLDANTKRSCPRPVLHGGTRAGTASADIVAFAEPTGELANCLHRVKDAEIGGKLADLVAQRAPHLVELDRACGAAIEEAVAAIASHEDACSPYQTGVRAEPPELGAPIRAAQMLALRARLRAEAGDVRGALWLIADALRAYDDLVRGNVTLIMAMVGTASSAILLEHAQAILETKPLASAAAEELGAAFEVILATSPPFGAVLAGEAEHMGLYTGLVKLRPAGWTPPGGTNKDLSELGNPMREPGSKLGTRDEGAMMIASALELGEAVARACSERATYADCHRHLVQLATTASSPRLEAMRGPAGMVQKLMADSSGKDTPETRERVRLQVQRMALDALASVVRPALHEYAAKRARALYRLAAARQSLDVIRAKRCPSADELESLDVRQSAAAMMGTLGDSLVATRDADLLRMQLPEWAAATAGPAWSWKQPCP